MTTSTYADARTAGRPDVTPPAEGCRRPVEETYDLLYRLHARPLFHYLLRLTLGDHREAEDYLQETFLRAWRWLLDRTVDPEIMRPWLYTVARRIVIDGVRAKQARPIEVFTTDLNRLSKSDTDIERLVQMHALRSALMSLSPEHRAALIEIFYHERTAKEAAEVLGVPEGTVKSRAHYAVRALRAAAVAGELAEFSTGRPDPGTTERRPARRASAPEPVAKVRPKPAQDGRHRSAGPRSARPARPAPALAGRG
jgi:RNA polymerase sigma-70 factor (ECF subfamily)